MMILSIELAEGGKFILNCEAGDGSIDALPEVYDTVDAAVAGVKSALEQTRAAYAAHKAQRKAAQKVMEGVLGAVLRAASGKATCDDPDCEACRAKRAEEAQG